ncbi:MAG: lipid-A-disaccharide synthase [Pseudomonadota bacterium]
MSAIRVALVVGEPSGDTLGAELIDEIRRLSPGAEFVGMAGPKMIAAGCRALANSDELAVMGLLEVLRHYPRLKKLQRALIGQFISDPPDVFVGIDVPDFNFGIERRLKAARIPTVHYVCPQAWAWRAARARKLTEVVDLLLALLPFEPEFFQQFGVPTQFVGHPLARKVEVERKADVAKQTLGLPTDASVLAILPGSRTQEVKRMASPFLRGAVKVVERQENLIPVACVAQAAHISLVREIADHLGLTDLEILCGQASSLLQAAEVALTSSGTVTLEAALAKCPQVVGYRMNPVSFEILRRLVTVEHIAMPNIISESDLVPELIQTDLTGERVASAAMRWLRDPAACAKYQQKCVALHDQLASDGELAARAVLGMVERTGG